MLTNIRNDVKKAHMSRMCVFLQVTFEQDSRQHYLKLLGYDPTELPKKVNYYSHYICMVNNV